MTVTENDITTNAAAIAALVNSTSTVTINGLAAVTNLASADILHCAVSGVDKKITKANALGELSIGKDANYTITDDDNLGIFYVTTGTSTITLTLPTLADNLNREIIVYKLDSGTGKITNDGEGAETINGVYVGGGATTADISQQYGFLKFKAFSSGWYITGGSTPDKWHYIGASGEPAFANSWVNYDGGQLDAAFRKLLNGNVQHRGVIKTGTVGNTAFTLPAGYFPSAIATLDTISNNATGKVVVGVAGAVTPSTPSNNTFVSLNGLFYSIL